MEYIAANLKTLRKHKGLTQDELSEQTGISRYKIGSYEEGRAFPKPNNLVTLAKFFDVSLDGLITEKINVKSIKVRKPIVNQGLQVLTTVVDRNNEERIALVPDKASAGYTSGYSDPEYIEQLPVFDLPLPELSRDRTYRVFQITGESMLPILPGSYIIGEYVTNPNSISFGKSHIVITKADGILFKRIEPNEYVPEKLTLISDNPEYNPYTIHKDEVLELWKARAYISTEFPEPKSTTIDRLKVLVEKLGKELNDV